MPLIIAVVNKDLDIASALLKGHPEAITKDSERRLGIEARRAGGDVEGPMKSALYSRATSSRSNVYETNIVFKILLRLRVNRRSATVAKTEQPPPDSR